MGTQWGIIFIRHLVEVIKGCWTRTGSWGVALERPEFVGVIVELEPEVEGVERPEFDTDAPEVEAVVPETEGEVISPEMEALAPLGMAEDASSCKE